MTTQPSEIAGDRDSAPLFLGAARLDAVVKEMFQSRALVELEQSLKRNPHYRLLKLKEQMAQCTAVVLGVGGMCAESVGGLHDFTWPTVHAQGGGRRDAHLGPADTKSGLWGGGEADRAAIGAACQTRSRGGTIRGPSCTGAESPAAAPTPNVVVDDCEELMMLLAKRNPDVPKMSARKIEELMIKEFGKKASFTYRTISETTLYRMWRKELKKARLNVDIDDLSDALDTGLVITSNKHGRSNRRKDYSAMQESAIREWKMGAQNAAAEASHRVADRKKGR